MTGISRNVLKKGARGKVALTGGHMLCSGSMLFFRKKKNYQHFSGTEFDFSRTLKFTIYIILSLPRSDH